MNTLREKYKEIITRYAEEVARLLAEEKNSDEDICRLLKYPLFPWHRTVRFKATCPFASENADSDTLQTIVMKGKRSGGLKELRDFTREAKSLIIIDPYIFSGENSNAKTIAEDLKKTARIGGEWLERIHFIYNKRNVTRAVKMEFKQILKSNSINMTESETNEIHDRVWIADRHRGIVVGTSLNGIGSRAAFLLPLPDTDLEELLDFLDEKGLSRSIIK